MAFARLLVVPPAKELCPVPDPLAGYVVEGDLDDELGAQPLPHQLLVGLPAARLARPALVGAVRLELREQLALLLCLESGCVADDVQLPVVVVHAEDQRAERALLLAE